MPGLRISIFQVFSSDCEKIFLHNNFATVVFYYFCSKETIMELSGKIIQVLEVVSGQGQNGTWKRQDFILEVPGQYPKKICITIFGDKVEQFNVKQGDDVRVEADIESREYNGRWYTSVKAWKVEKAGGDMQDRMPDYDSAQNAPMSGGVDLSASDGDDLPF